MQKWKKLNILFNVGNTNDWAISHAMMPCIYQKDEHNFSIFFSARDSYNQARPASVNLDMSNFTFSNTSKIPLLELGDIGAFDDSGIMPTCLVNVNHKLYMYYNGWTLGKKIPFWSFNSVAISKDNGESFNKKFKYPNVLYRNEVDTFSTFAPFVLKIDNDWRMWYVSCTKWTYDNNVPKHYYHIKYAHSKNGIDWIREGKICIDFKSTLEYAIARPMVIYENKLYKMWYSYRASPQIETYRIGYATSTNGVDWIRKDEEVGIDVSESGWDSEMICYSYIFDYKDNRYMLYNGNGYGKTGFGIAILEK